MERGESEGDGGIEKAGSGKTCLGRIHKPTLEEDGTERERCGEDRKIIGTNFKRDVLRKATIVFFSYD